LSPGTNGIPLDALARDPRWVAWRNESRGGRLTKVPYSTPISRAKANNSKSWRTRDAAEACTRANVKGIGGGIGIMLGDLGDGMVLIGVDLDTCRDSATGAFDHWATQVIERFNSYTEISPSNTGAKIFALICTEALAKVRAETGIKHGRTFAQTNGTGAHPPAIELHIGNRYFAVTGRRVDGAREELAIVDPAALKWLLTEHGPAFAGCGKKSKATRTDNSRSAAAFRIARQMRRARKTYEEFREAVRTDSITANWFAEKGILDGERELHRAFDKEEVDSDDNLPAITVRAGLRHVAADAGLAAMRAADVPFYQRDQSIVRICRIPAKTSGGEVTLTPGIVTVSHAFLCRVLGRVARWEKFDRHGKIVRIDPPRPIIEQISEMVGEWSFPCSPVSSAPDDAPRWQPVAGRGLRRNHRAGTAGRAANAANPGPADTTGCGTRTSTDRWIARRVPVQGRRREAPIGRSRRSVVRTDNARVARRDGRRTDAPRECAAGWNR
jgi:hypothetical protein